MTDNPATHLATHHVWIREYPKTVTFLVTADGSITHDAAGVREHIAHFSIGTAASARRRVYTNAVVTKATWAAIKVTGAAVVTAYWKRIAFSDHHILAACCRILAVCVFFA